MKTLCCFVILILSAGAASAAEEPLPLPAAEKGAILVEGVIDDVQKPSENSTAVKAHVSQVFLGSDKLVGEKFEFVEDDGPTSHGDSLKEFSPQVGTKALFVAFKAANGNLIVTSDASLFGVICPV